MSQAPRAARRGLLLVAVLAILGAGVTVAVAASPHFKNGGTPTCRDTGTTLACTGTLAGLGNEALVIDLKADALATFGCGTPGNGKLSPGQNKIPFTATGSQTILPQDFDKNGNATFNVFAPQTPPPTPTPEEAGCANPNWQVKALTGIDFSNVELKISQGGVLLFTCTFLGQVPTNGSRVTLSCV
jgi:hypothetical protein